MTEGYKQNSWMILRKKTTVQFVMKLEILLNFQICKKLIKYSEL